MIWLVLPAILAASQADRALAQERIDTDNFSAAASSGCYFDWSIQNVGPGCAVQTTAIARLYDSTDAQVGSDVAMGSRDGVRLSSRTIRPNEIVPISSFGRITRQLVDRVERVRLFPRGRTRRVYSALRSRPSTSSSARSQGPAISGLEDAPRRPHRGRATIRPLPARTRALGPLSAVPGRFPQKPVIQGSFARPNTTGPLRPNTTGRGRFLRPNATGTYK